MSDQEPTNRVRDLRTNAIANIYEMVFPQIIRTGSMGSAAPLLETKDRSRIVAWGDDAYDAPDYFSSAANFNHGDKVTQYYDVDMFIFVAYENNSGAVIRDAFIYAQTNGRTISGTTWRLVAICLQAIPDQRTEVECAYLDTKRAEVVFCDRHGKVGRRLPIPKVTAFLKQRAHISDSPPHEPGN